VKRTILLIGPLVLGACVTEQGPSSMEPPPTSGGSCCLAKPRSSINATPLASSKKPHCRPAMRRNLKLFSKGINNLGTGAGCAVA